MLLPKIKRFTSDHVILAGLIGSLIYNGIAYGLTFVYWGVNPIFPPPVVMLFPGVMVSALTESSYARPFCEQKYEDPTKTCQRASQRDETSGVTRDCLEQTKRWNTKPDGSYVYKSDGFYEKCVMRDPDWAACIETRNVFERCLFGLRNGFTYGTTFLFFWGVFYFIASIYRTIALKEPQK